MKKALLVTMGAFMLLQAPVALSEEMVTISVKELSALKSLCSSIQSVTPASSGGTSTAVPSAPAAAAAVPAIGNAVKVASLRGFHNLDDEAKAIEKKKLIKVAGGIERNWQLQPPSIPHNIEKDRITLKGNTCLRCHSKVNAEKEKAPAVPETHFVTRDKKILDKLSTRRYFCNQCHTPQADVDPLVESSFEKNSIELNNLVLDSLK